MIDNHPVPALFHECKAIARWQRSSLIILDIRERVVAGVDSRVVVNTNQLLSERDPEIRQNFEGCVTK